MSLKISGVSMGNLTGGPTDISLSDLSDVSIVSPQNGQYLRYNATIEEWQNTAVGTDLFNFLNSNLSGTNGVTVTATPGPNSVVIGLGAITPTSVAATGTVTGSNLSGTNTGDQTITLTGDVTGSGTGSFSATLATVNSSPQDNQLRKLTFNSKGLITSSTGVSDSDLINILGFTPINIAGDTMDSGADLTFASGGEVLGLPATPSGSTAATSKAYVDSVVEGLKAKPAAEIATTGPLDANYNNGDSGVGATLTSTTNTAFPTIDGVTLTSTDFGSNGVLVKDQSNSAHNGRYNLTQVGSISQPWILTRCLVCDEPNEIPGAYVFIKQGTLYAGTGWVAITPTNPPVVGTTAINWTQFSGAESYSAGAGLTLTGNEFSITDTGVSPGTYKSVTVNTRGQITSGSNPTTLSGYGITDAQPLDSDLTALSNISTTGLYSITGTGSSTTRTIEVSGNGIQITNGNGVAGNPLITLNSDSANTASTIVLRDSSGNFSAGTITASLTGSASLNILKSGDTMTGALALIPGNQSAPSVYMTGDTSTGIFSPAAGILAFTTNGSEKLRINSSGALGLSGTNFGTAGQVLTSNGSANAPTWETLSVTLGNTVTIGTTPNSPINLSGINGTTSGSSTMTIRASSTTTGNGNSLILVGGAGNSTGGSIIVRGGLASTGSGGPGGNSSLLGGDGTTAGSGGSVTVSGGAAAGASFNGGQTTITSGPGGTAGPGGNVFIQSGTGGTSSGNITIQPGEPGNSGVGIVSIRGSLLNSSSQFSAGSIIIEGGLNQAKTSSPGGTVTISGGSVGSPGTGNGGNLILENGLSTGGAGGNITFRTGNTVAGGRVDRAAITPFGEFRFFGPITESSNNIGNVSGSTNITLSIANYITFTITGSTTFTFVDPPANGRVGAYVLEITNGGSSSITWPVSVNWIAGSAPTLRSSGINLVGLITRDGGTSYIGTLLA